MCVCVTLKVEKVKRSYVTCDANATSSEVAQGCGGTFPNHPGLSKGGDGAGDGVQGAMSGLHDELFSVPRLNYFSHVIREKSSNKCFVFVAFPRSHDPMVSNGIITSYGGLLRQLKQMIDSSQEVLYWILWAVEAEVTTAAQLEQFGTLNLSPSGLVDCLMIIHLSLMSTPHLPRLHFVIRHSPHIKFSFHSPIPHLLSSPSILSPISSIIISVCRHLERPPSFTSPQPLSSTSLEGPPTTSSTSTTFNKA